MAFVPGNPVTVDQTNVGTVRLTDLRVTPGGGFQVVWDTASGFSGPLPRETSYRIFDSAGLPLTGEIIDASYVCEAPPAHLQQSIQLDDGTTLKVETVFNTSFPGSKRVLQLYDQAGMPLGEPVFTANIDSGAGGLAQLPNRDIAFVASTVSKTGVYSIVSWVLDNTSPDLYPPVLSHVAADGNIVLVFNELVALAPSARIDLKTASGELVDSFDASDGADLSAWVSSITIKPAVTLAPGADYVLEFAPGSLLDPSGNAFSGGGVNFTTAGEASPGGDTTAPAAIDFFPAAGSSMLPPDWSLGITFNEDVKAGAGTITLETAAGAVVQTFAAGDPGIHLNGASVIIDPAADLQPGTTYQLVVDAGAVVDLAGNAYGGVSGHSFTTAGSAPGPGTDTTAPAAIDFFPAAGSSRLPPEWSLGITFNEDVKAGAGTITLQTAAGAVVQTFAAGDPGIHFNGASLIMDPAADLQPGTTYQLVVDAGAVVDLAGNAYGGVSGHSFTTAGSAPGPGTDTTAPVAIDLFPAAGSSMLPPEWSLGITFNEDVKAGAGTIILQSAAGAVVQRFVTDSDPGIHFNGASLIIDPAADLQPGTTYTLVVFGDAVVDLVGNPYRVDAYSFTTAG